MSLINKLFNLPEPKITYVPLTSKKMIKVPPKTLDMLKTTHDYHFTSSEYEEEIYETWQQFIQQAKTWSIALNPVFRWDLQDNNQLEIIFLKPRKNYCWKAVIKNPQHEDAESIISFLQQRYKYLQDIWQPISITE